MHFRYFLCFQALNVNLIRKQELNDKINEMVNHDKKKDYEKKWKEL